MTKLDRERWSSMYAPDKMIPNEDDSDQWWRVLHDRLGDDLIILTYLSYLIKMIIFKTMWFLFTFRISN